MLLTLLVIVVVSGALVAGAALGIYSGLSDEAESFSSPSPASRY